MESTRQKKFAREIQKLLSQVLQKEVEKPLSCLITVSQVKVTPDLQIARVYLTCYPEAKTAEVLTLLTDGNKTIRHLLAGGLRHTMRVMPNLEFFEDDTPRVARKIDELFEKIKAEDEARQALAPNPEDTESEP